MERVDRGDPYYKACIAASTAAGAISGNVVAGVSAPITGGLSFAALPWGGIALGFGVGFLACPYLAPFIRSKFEKNLPLDDFTMNQSIRAMSQYAGVHNSSDAVKLLAVVRNMPKNRAADVSVCHAPPMAAKSLLARLTTV